MEPVHFRWNMCLQATFISETKPIAIPTYVKRQRRFATKSGWIFASVFHPHFPVQLRIKISRNLKSPQKTVETGSNPSRNRSNHPLKKFVTPVQKPVQLQLETGRMFPPTPVKSPQELVNSPPGTNSFQKLQKPVKLPSRNLSNPLYKPVQLRSNPPRNLQNSFACLATG